ncbi:MAG: AraC family transcriptional regulator [Lentisphaerales bacterium]|nr:AraC family transcriptional regulator [Lentisphaerales bacterium]
MKINKEKMFRSTSGSLPMRIRPVFEDFHRLTVNEDCDYPEHKHSKYELIVVDRGPYRCTLNGELILLKFGEFLIIKPGDVHQDHFRCGQDHYVLHFGLSSAQGVQSSVIQLFDKKVNPQKQMGVRSLDTPFTFFKKLTSELGQADVFSTYIQDSMLETFFWQLIRLLPQETLSGQFQQLSRQLDFHTKLQDIFSQHYKSSYSVQEMAAEMGMSERTLVYRCKEFINQTPAKAFTCYRVHKAAELLGSTDLAIQEVANEFGFENPFHFSRVFKSVMKCSPKSYRD